MDARTFEPDEPLPRICKHCRWSFSRVFDHDPKEMFCDVAAKGANSLRWGHTPRSTKPNHTCDQWEEKA
jgi:hypothetical protein